MLINKNEKISVSYDEEQDKTHITYDDCFAIDESEIQQITSILSRQRVNKNRALCPEILIDGKSVIMTYNGQLEYCNSFCLPTNTRVQLAQELLRCWAQFQNEGVHLCNFYVHCMLRNLKDNLVYYDFAPLFLKVKDELYADLVVYNNDFYFFLGQDSKQIHDELKKENLDIHFYMTILIVELLCGCSIFKFGSFDSLKERLLQHKQIVNEKVGFFFPEFIRCLEGHNTIISSIKTNLLWRELVDWERVVNDRCPICGGGLLSVERRTLCAGCLSQNIGKVTIATSTYPLMASRTGFATYKMNNKTHVNRGEAKYIFKCGITDANDTQIIRIGFPSYFCVGITSGAITLEVATDSKSNMKIINVKPEKDVNFTVDMHYNDNYHLDFLFDNSIEGEHVK